MDTTCERGVAVALDACNIRDLGQRLTKPWTAGEKRIWAGVPEQNGKRRDSDNPKVAGFSALIGQNREVTTADRRGERKSHSARACRKKRVQFRGTASLKEQE